MKPQAQFPNTPLHLGEPVPYFEADSQLGRVKLSDYQGRWLVLFSYPADFTPVCTSEVVAFSRIQDQLRGVGCEVVGLSTDSVAAHLPWLQSIEDWMGEAIRFPVVGDFDGHIASRYGMIMPHLSQKQAARCTFIMDEEQVLQAFMAYPPNVGRNMDEVVRLVRALQATKEESIGTPANWQCGNGLIPLHIAFPPTKGYQTHGCL